MASLPATVDLPCRLHDACLRPRARPSWSPSAGRVFEIGVHVSSIPGWGLVAMAAAIADVRTPPADRLVCLLARGHVSCMHTVDERGGSREAPTRVGHSLRERPVRVRSLLVHSRSGRMLRRRSLSDPTSSVSL